MTDVEGVPCTSYWYWDSPAELGLPIIIAARSVLTPKGWIDTPLEIYLHREVPDGLDPREVDLVSLILKPDELAALIAAGNAHEISCTRSS